MRTVLALFGITLAVLAVTLLAGTGIGVVETGQEKFDAAGRDLWVTGGPVQFAPGAVGGVDNSITDAHAVSRRMRQREGVATASPLLFQTVYASPDRSSFRTVAAVGIRSSGGVRITQGDGFRDVHYANGTYDGPMTHEILIDRRTAALFDVSVGDTLYVGGTVTTAREHAFTVVGISSTTSEFVGAPTITMPLSELQEVTGSTGTDPATLITIKLQQGVDPQRVEAGLQAAHPEYEVRTNQEQLEATLERQAVVLASGVSLVVLAILAGVALTINIFLSIVYQQRRELAALKALGGSTRTLAGILVVQALVLGLVGGIVGVALTVPVAAVVDRGVAAVTGFDDVVRLPVELLVVGPVIALVTSLAGAVAAGIRIRRLSPLDELRR